MIVEAEKLRKFVGIVGIGGLGNFEAKTQDGKLVASVVSATNAVLISAELPVSVDGDEEIKIYANADIFIKKYLEVFDKKTVLTIETNEDTVAITDENLTLYMPQIAPEVAAKNTRQIRKEVKFDTKVIFPAKDYKRIRKAMEKLDENEIRFIVENGKLKITISEKAVLETDAEVSGNGLERIFRKVVLDDALSYADGLITLEFNSQQVNHPVKFSYETSGISVEGFMMPLVEVETEDEEDGEE